MTDETSLERNAPNFYFHAKQIMQGLISINNEFTPQINHTA
jgi:hypothetical protein